MKKKSTPGRSHLQGTFFACQRQESTWHHSNAELNKRNALQQQALLKAIIIRPSKVACQATHKQATNTVLFYLFAKKNIPHT
jgi:hypothetical protein